MSDLYKGPRTPERLVVLLHGVGSRPASLEPLAEEFARVLPKVGVFVPEGFDPFDSGPFGRQWFSIRGVTDENRPDRIEMAMPRLEELLDQALAAAGLDRDRLVIGGFSQGAMMALALAAGPRPPVAAIALSGRLSAPIAAVSPRPAIFLGHGQADTVVSVAHAESAAAMLTAEGFQVTKIIETGLGHAISPSLAAGTIAWLCQQSVSLAV